MQEEPPPPRAPGAAAPDRTTGLGSRALRFSGLILVARILSRLLALVAVVTIGNALGDARFGELQTAVTYTALVGAITDVGFTALYVREGARERFNLTRYFNNVASMKLFLVAVALPALFACLWFAGIGGLLFPAFALLVLSGYSLLLRSTLYALQRLNFEIAEIIPETAVILGMALIGAHLHAGADFFLWAYAASSGFATVYFVVVLFGRGILVPRWRLELGLFRTWIRAGIPLAITYLLTTVYFKVDVPILQHERSYAEVGWYTFAYRPFEALLFIPATLRTVVFPVLSIYYRDAPNRVLASAEKLFKGLAIIGWPVTVGLVILAPQFIAFLTSQYPQSAAALRILGVAVVFMFVDNTFAAVLNAIDRQKLYAYVALSGLVINVGLNLILIPHFGYIGASWATVATEVGLVITGWLALRSVLGPLRVVHACWKPFVAGVVMGLVVWPLNPHGRLAIVAVVLLGAVAYAVMLVVLRTADDEERTIIRRALGRPARGRS